MKISTLTDEFSRALGDEAAIKRLSQIGFDAIDYSLYIYSIDYELFKNNSYVEYYKQIKKTAEENNITIELVHAVFPVYTADPEQDEKIFDLLIKSIEITSIIGCHYIVIHPPIPADCKYDHFRKEAHKLAVDIYQRLKPYAKRYDVKIAIENMFSFDEERNAICPTICSTAEEMADMIDELGNDTFVACLDTGHANLTGDTPEHMIEVLNDRLKVLHVHDNNGINDDHTAPFMGNINWENVCVALKKINYKGVLNFESDGFYNSFPKAMLSDSAEFVLKIGKNLINTYNL